jgi:hypothetical protein
MGGGAAVIAATAALIFWVALWHVLAFLPLLPAFPPALLVSGLTWAFVGWVWPAGAPVRHAPPYDGDFLTGVPK